MSQTVGDIMNPQLLFVCEDDYADVRARILKFGVTAVPVLDSEQRPIGMISLRDLDHDGKPRHVSAPVVCVRKDDAIEAAARVLAETSFHHLVVVDDDGVAVGMVSAVDFLRALSGLAPRHPNRFDIPSTHSEES